MSAEPISSVNSPHWVYCWFVENNGLGHKGYVFINTAMGRPMTTGENLFSTLGELREALKKAEGEPVYLIPKYPNWVPEGWKVRDLDANEVEQLKSSLKLIIRKEPRF